MSLRHLSIDGFRNLATQQLTLPSGVIAVVGANGAGKTNLLEAIAVLGNVASFRPGASTGLVQRGRAGFVLAGEIEREAVSVSLRQVTRLGRVLGRSFFRGARRLDAAEYVSVFPVAVLSSHDRLLVWGGPEERRRFLDRIAFFLHTQTLHVAQRYRRCLKQRNALLLAGRPDAEFDAFEEDLAVLGARLVALRLEALAALERALTAELADLGWSLPHPHLRYDAADGLAPGDQETLAARLRTLLARGRRHERARGHTIVGPHRHDVVFTVGGVPGREMLSAGQGKLLATACKLAAVTIFERVRGRTPTLVFDDVDAELDARVLERILARISSAPQALLSSAHEEMMVPRLPNATVWRARAGVVELPMGGN